jgi:SAM-dependent methyltransferase
MDTLEEAVTYPRGSIHLHHCQECDFIFNAAFDGSLHQYSARYEETQGYSSTFRAFHQRLAERLIQRWDIRDKRVLEIGCGKGEFLALLCELGGNIGIGYDPAFVPERRPCPEGVELQFHRETYPPKSGTAALDPPPDLLCCKMTLEHIPNVREFVTGIRHSLPDTPGTVIFFQVPEAERIFREAAFWDIYYEHCSYFTRASLASLFDACGFEVADVWTDYQGQYLMLTAIPAGPALRDVTLETNPMSPVGFATDLESFASRVVADVERWRDRISAELAQGGCVCLWGGGSKAVAFLSVVGHDMVSFVVDINLHKVGTYLPGSGLEIVGPEALCQRAPSLVIAMNAVYVDEIAAEMRSRGVAAKLAALA